MNATQKALIIRPNNFSKPIWPFFPTKKLSIGYQCTSSKMQTEFKRRESKRIDKVSATLLEFPWPVYFALELIHIQAWICLNPQV